MPHVEDVEDDTEEEKTAEEVLGGDVGHPPGFPGSAHRDQPDRRGRVKAHPIVIVLIILIVSRLSTS